MTGIVQAWKKWGASEKGQLEARKARECEIEKKRIEKSRLMR